MIFYLCFRSAETLHLYNSMISGGADLHRCRATPSEVVEHPLVAQTAAEKNWGLGKPC